MYKLLKKLEGENKFELLAKGKSLHDILMRLCCEGVISPFNYIESYVESVSNGNEDNIRQYLKDTIDNYFINHEISVNTILKREVDLYICNHDERIFAFGEQYGKGYMIRTINCAIEHENMILVEEV